jgi:hypothetical protein
MTKGRLMFTARTTRRMIGATAGLLSVVLFASTSSAESTSRTVEGRSREEDTSVACTVVGGAGPIVVVASRSGGNGGRQVPSM